MKTLKCKHCGHIYDDKFTKEIILESATDEASGPLPLLKNFSMLVSLKCGACGRWTKFKGVKTWDWEIIDDPLRNIKEIQEWRIGK